MGLVIDVIGGMICVITPISLICDGCKGIVGIVKGEGGHWPIIILAIVVAVGKGLLVVISSDWAK